MEISAKSILNSTEDPNVAWEVLDKHFGAKQQGLQSVLMTKLLITKWDGSGIIYTHHEFMVNLHAELSVAGTTITNQSQYSPESNGVTERAIRVLTNAVHAMLHKSGLPKSLWAEAFNTMTYVHNRTPMKALGSRMPFEVQQDCCGLGCGCHVCLVSGKSIAVSWGTPIHKRLCIMMCNTDTGS